MGNTDMIGYCGLNCPACLVYEVARRGDEASKKEAAEEWNRKYGFRLTAADMVCDGCRTDGGRLFDYCTRCRVRTCAAGRGLATCAECKEYICPKLDEVIDLEPQVKVELEKRRQR